jgi:hypothetical protein
MMLIQKPSLSHGITGLCVTLTSLSMLGQIASAQTTSPVDVCHAHILRAPEFKVLPKSEVELSAGETSVTGLTPIYWHVETLGVFGYCHIGPAPAHSIYSYNKIGPFSPETSTSTQTQTGSSQIRPRQQVMAEYSQVLPNPSVGDSGPRCWVNNSTC